MNSSSTGSPRSTMKSASAAGRRWTSSTTSAPSSGSAGSRPPRTRPGRRVPRTMPSPMGRGSRARSSPPVWSRTSPTPGRRARPPVRSLTAATTSVVVGSTVSAAPPRSPSRSRPPQAVPVPQPIAAPAAKLSASSNGTSASAGTQRNAAWAPWALPPKTRTEVLRAHLRPPGAARAAGRTARVVMHHHPRAFGRHRRRDGGSDRVDDARGFVATDGARRGGHTGRVRQADRIWK